MKALIYSRVSTLPQDYARQVADLKEYAKYKKYDVVQVFEEKISGTVKTKDRGEFSKVIKIIEDQKIDHLLVHELSRLGRKMSNVIETVTQLAEKGVNIYIKKENLNTLDDKGKLSIMTSIIISVLSGFDEMEKEAFRFRSTNGIRHNVSQGGSGTGIVKAYGYKKEGKKLTVDKQEAKVVKLVFDKYLSGLGTQKIAKYLNSQNIPTRFNKLYPNKLIPQKYGVTKKGSDFSWKDGTVYSMLTNSIYIGDRKHKGEIFPIEAIIEKETFEKVQKRLKQNYNKKGINTKYPNPLEDLLICGTCGRGYYQHKRENGKDNAYKCITMRYGEYCGSPSINIDKLQQTLYIGIIPDSQNAIGEKDFKLKIQDTLDNKEIEKVTIEKDIEKLNKQLNKVVRMHVSDEMDSKQYTELRTEYLNKIKKFEERLDIVSNDIDKTKNMVKKSFKSGADYNIQMFNKNLKDVVDHVKVYTVDDDKRMKLGYDRKADVGIFIELKMSVAFRGYSSDFKYYVLSRYTDRVLTVELTGKFSTEASRVKLIQTGKYKPKYEENIEEAWNALNLALVSTTLKS